MKGDKKRIASALQAIEEGQLCVEDILRAALRLDTENTGLRDWLDVELERSSRRDPARVSIRRRRLPPHSVRDAAVKQVRDLVSDTSRFSGIMDVDWGVPAQGGRPRGWGAVLVWVESKRRDISAEERLPREVVIEKGTRKYRIPIDIQVYTPGEQQGVRPGDSVKIRTASSAATLSAILNHKNPPVALVSGHAVKKGQSVTAISSSKQLLLGTVTDVKLSSEMDVATVSINNNSNIESLTLKATSTRRITQFDVDQNLKITIDRRVGRGNVSAYVFGKNKTAVFKNGKKLNGAIRLDRAVTIDGDSGAPAFDPDGNLVGFVVGTSHGKTHLIPVKSVLNAID